MRKGEERIDLLNKNRRWYTCPNIIQQHAKYIIGGISYYFKDRNHNDFL